MKKILQEILDYIENNITDDNFVFSRMHQCDKTGKIIKSCVLGHLEKDKNILTSKIKSPKEDPYNKIIRYLFRGDLLELKDTTKGKTLISKQPILTPLSTLIEVKEAFKFIISNYDKVIKAL